MADLQADLGYRFSDPRLLQRALTHRSLEAEEPAEVSNERMEFLGDAVLGLVVAAALFDSGDMDEGAMAKVRAAVVDTTALAAVARSLQLGSHLRLGKGEEVSGGADKSSILADALEAVIGAIFLDGGFEPARRFVLEQWDDLIADRAGAPGGHDYKTRLQEELAKHGIIPEYEVAGSGPDHARSFTALVSVEGRELGHGSGTSKKRAEQDAARRALDALGDA